MAAKKEIYITAELDWAEEKLQEWKSYIDANPFDKMVDTYKRLIVPEHIKGDKKYYCYFHFRVKESEYLPFYIGVGTQKKGRTKYARAKSKKRNTFWKNVVINSDYIIVIAKESDSYKEILQYEIDCISDLGKRIENTGVLVNITNGGEGTLGFSMSEQEKKKRSLKYTGSGNPRFGKIGKLNPLSIPVCQYDLEGNLIATYESRRIAAQSIGVSHTTINKAIKKGYKCKNTILKWQQVKNQTI